MKTFYALSFSLFICFNAISQPGSLDPSFAKNGVSIKDFNNDSYDELHDIAVQADGKIIAVGYTDNPGFILRYTTDGLVDSSFGKNGLVKVVFGDNNDINLINAVAIQTDGKIVVTGGGYKLAHPSRNFSTARYLTNGKPDSSFGTDGFVITDIDNNDEEGSSVAIQKNGKIVIAGVTYKTPTSGAVTVVRYNANGTPDNSFGDSGIATIIRNGYIIMSQVSCAINEDGKIIAGGSAHTNQSSNNNIFLYRLNSNGTPDNGFGYNGVVTTGLLANDESALGLVSLKNNKLVVCGNVINNYGRSDFAVIKYNEDGSLDKGFGKSGIARTHFGGNEQNNFALDIAVQNNGQIILGGYTYNLSQQYSLLALVRYNSGGNLDTTFGNKGISTLSTSYKNSQATSLAIQQPNNKIIAGGLIIPKSAYYPDVLLSRFFLNTTQNIITSSPVKQTKIIKVEQ